MRMIGFTPGWILPLLLCTLALGHALPTGSPHAKDREHTEEDQEDQGQTIHRFRRETNDGSAWQECHGFPQKECIRLRDKITELQQILSKQNGPPGQTYAHQILSNASMTADEEEELFLTPGQVQYFINTLGNRRRQKRKVDSFSQFVTKWPLPIHYQFDGSHNSYDRQKIKEAISHWETQTCLRFREVAQSDQTTDNRIMFMKYKGCGSYIGKVNISPQPVDLASRCLRHFGIIAHEIGHVIGFWHEHQRSDRDSYIDIKIRNAVTGISFISELMRLGRTTNLLPYDYGSVLHYNAKTMSANGDYTIETKNSLYQKTIGQRTGLSYLDAKLANMVYCGDVCQVPLRRPCQNAGYQDPNACHQCRCPDGFAGAYCTDIATSVGAICGGTYDAIPIRKVLLSPGYYRGFYNDYTSCSWLLKAPVGYQVVLRFDDEFGVYCIEETCFHWVEIRYEVLSNIGPRFCCGTVPQVTMRSSSNEMLVLFRSNYTTLLTNSRRGFRATFWSAPARNVNTGPAPRWYTHGPGRTTPAAPPRKTTPFALPTLAPIIKRVNTQAPTQPPWVYPTDKYSSCSPIDVAFILDSSGSIGYSNWPKLIEFTTQLVRRWKIGYNDVRIGVVSYGSSASLHFNLHTFTDQDQVISAIQGIRWKDEMTNTSGGIWMTRLSIFNPSNGDRPWAPNVAILITDGESNRDEYKTIPEAVISKQAGITMMVIGVGNRVKRSEVESVTSEPKSETLFFVNSFDDLNRIGGEVSQRVCSLTRQAVTRLTTPVNTVLSRRTQLWPRGTSTSSSIDPRDCTNPAEADIAFVVDSSGSIGQLNWRKILDFLKTFVGYLSINNDVHRVGVVTFGTLATFDFGLNAFRSDWQLRDAIDRLRWKDEMTNTSGGIRVMRELLFDPRQGDRPNVPNIAIVLTDGESNRDPLKVPLEASLTQATGISMFVIGIGNKLNMRELENIASEPKGQYLYRTQDFNDLSYVITSMINVICTLTRSPRPTNIPPPTGYSTKVTPYRTPQPPSFQPTHPTPVPTRHPTPHPTRYPSPHPTQYPSPNPTRYPSPHPTQYPSPHPTQYPSPHPTQYPSPHPTQYPSPHPTQYPSPNPTRYPSPHPTQYPSPNPTRYPNPHPTQYPSPNPTRYPSPNPTRYPSPHPTQYPSPYPTQYPTPHPTRYPTPYPGTSPTSNGPIRTSPTPRPSGGALGCPIYADIAFVLDSSGSVGSFNWPLVLNFTKTIIRMFPYGSDAYQFGVVSFGNEATLDIYLTEYRHQLDIMGGIDKIRWKDEWTNTSGGLKVMHEELYNIQRGARAYASKIAILITDGESNRDQQQTLPQAIQVQRKGIKVFSIGVGPNVDISELKAISSDPDDWYLTQVESYQRLWTIARDIAKKICDTANPVTRVTPSPTSTSTKHVVTYTPAPTSSTETITYFPPGGTYAECYPMDIGIAIDSSNSVGSNNWRRMLNFVAEVLRSLPISPHQVKVGVITFGNKATLNIPLDTYPYIDGLLDALLRLPWKDQWTNTSGAILVMRSQLLTNRDPSRHKVPKIGIVITDGQSNIDSHLTIPEANVARQQAIEMYAIGVTPQASTQEVNGIANKPVSEHAYFADNFDDLYQVKDRLLRDLCSRYDRSNQGVQGGIPAKPASTTTAASNLLGAWTACTRPCGGCGRRWRYKQCPDAHGTLSDCGQPEEDQCNIEPCTANDVCTFYVAWKQYYRPCQPCCYGYEHSTRLNKCIAT